MMARWVFVSSLCRSDVLYEVPCLYKQSKTIPYSASFFSSAGVSSGFAANTYACALRNVEPSTKLCLCSLYSTMVVGSRPRISRSLSLSLFLTTTNYPIVEKDVFALFHTEIMSSFVRRAIITPTTFGSSKASPIAAKTYSSAESSPKLPDPATAFREHPRFSSPSESSSRRWGRSTIQKHTKSPTSQAGTS